MSNEGKDKVVEYPINKPVKRVAFFDAKQHVEIIRQVKGETVYVARTPYNSPTPYRKNP